MRELKVKAFDNERNEMLTPDQLIHLEGNMTKALKESSPFLTLIQFTGLTDKNREMWESDLFELLLNGIETHTELVIYEIRWNDKVCGFGFFKITKDSEQPEWIGLNDKSILDKVYKGNIHQDKNLLK